MVVAVISNQSSIIIYAIFLGHVLKLRGQIFARASDFTQGCFWNELLFHGNFKQVLNGIEYEDKGD